MPWWIWVLIGIGVLVVLGLAARGAYGKRRSGRLRESFGPEYDRTVRATGDRRGAESELEARRKRREELDIRPLDPTARARYAESWRDVQGRFVDSPGDAVRDADRLVIVVMRERGYPMDDFETRAADLSVDYPNLVQNYRSAHAVSQASERRGASTEDLRRAMVHYRSLFQELLGWDDEAHGRREAR